METGQDRFYIGHGLQINSAGQVLRLTEFISRIFSVKIVSNLTICHMDFILQTQAIRLLKEENMNYIICILVTHSEYVWVCRKFMQAYASDKICLNPKNRIGFLSTVKLYFEINFNWIVIKRKELSHLCQIILKWGLLRFLNTRNFLFLLKTVCIGKKNPAPCCHSDVC